ncbi:MAG: hypothetical protein ACOC6G_02520 [Thermoproteota archaeon]
MRKTISIMTITMLLISTVMMMAPMANAAISINLSANVGNVGDEITVSGSGASAYSQVEIYWENLGGQKLGETYANSAGEYDVNIMIPEDVAGDHAVVARDVSTGNTAGQDFTIQPEITLDPTSGIPGDTVSVEGTGFGSEKSVNITLGVTDVTPSGEITTSSSGSFTTTFEVPDLSYDTYSVTAEDESGNTATTPFKVGASITLTPAEGPTGTVVDVEGRGFIGDKVNVTFGAILVLENVEVTEGKFSGSFVTPGVSLGAYTVTADDSSTASATADFEVTGVSGITLEPATGQAESTVSITGENFTAKEGTTVTVNFYGTEVGTYTTDSNGGFSGTFTVPALPPDTYSVTAEDENALSAGTTFQVVFTYVGLTPSSGPTGKGVVITGAGFTPNTSFNVTMNGELMVNGQGTTTSNGNLPPSFKAIVPTLPVGTYTVTVTDSTGVTGTAMFTVTDTTTLTAEPASAPRTYQVTVEGSFFTGESGVPVDVDFSNSTWKMNAFSTTTNATGGFTGTFTVPDRALGEYTINATDANGLTAETTFILVEPTYNIEPRADAYTTGDKISFYINCSFPVDLYINISDPTGYTMLETDWTFWTQVGDWWVVPFSSQWDSAFTGLPDDAPTGTYSWTAIDQGEDKAVAGGTFTVEEKVTSNEVLDRLDEMNATLTAINDGIATVETSVGDVEADLEDLDASISSVDDGVATIETTVGEIDVVLGDMAGRVVDIEECAGQVAADLDDLGAEVTSISDGVATIETDVGTLTGTVEDIEGDVATIQTDLDTVQMDVSDVKSDTQAIAGLSTPLWIVVALSLVAAIAAIAAVVSIYSKLA